jgi:hypothetical protein
LKGNLGFLKRSPISLVYYIPYQRISAGQGSEGILILNLLNYNDHVKKSHVILFVCRELEKIEVEGLDLYLPTAPTQLVRGIQLDSGIPLQSAAKVPIMVTFDVVDKNEPKVLKSQACIFKVGASFTLYFSAEFACMYLL